MKRKTYDGERHFCSSVWITTTSKPKKILLVHHKKLGKWLQPGGHIERFENPIDAAIREIREEAGIDISFLSKQIKVIDQYGTFLPIPKFIMEQTIPVMKKEPQHYHLDLQYYLEIPEQKLLQNSAESHSIGWFTKDEALRLPIHEDTRVVINKLM